MVLGMAVIVIVTLGEGWFVATDHHVFSSASYAGNSPYLLDSMILSGKRADLRLAVAGKGMEAGI